MGIRTYVSVGVMVLGEMAGAGAQPLKDYPITPVDFTRVRVQDDFWKRRLDVNRTVTIPYALEKCKETGRIDNFAIAAGLKTGKFCGYQFNDSDVFKVIEGAAYSLSIHPDAALDAYLDDLIAKIAGAQEPDGYLYTARKLMSGDYSPPGGKLRWVGEKDGSHELYNAGHLYEAAVAHFLATGKRTLLNVALRNADLVCSTFGPNGRHEVPGHEEIEIGLCKLYRLTGAEKYLRTAKFFLDERGDSTGHALIGQYAQDHKPVLEQTEAVGHAVRAMYMYSGMADVAALTGDRSYVHAIDRLWEDVVGTKMYLTGGIGATGDIEGFGAKYELPNANAYCETCAAIANALWNYRMFLLHGDGRYLDVLERVLYNGFLSGISMAGDRFFYPNPLESFRGADRSPWFDCACCPSNDVRFVPSIPGYIYAHRGDTLYVNLFIGSFAKFALGQDSVELKQETSYPWEGRSTITVEPDHPAEFTLNIRLPGWTRNEPVPGSLYHYLDEQAPAVTITVNGQIIAYELDRGFASIRRSWQKGDVVTVTMPMEVRRVAANANVEADRGRVGLECGPIVFCLEGPDNKDGRVLNLVIREGSPLRSEFRSDLLGGVEVIQGSAVPVARTLRGTTSQESVQTFTAVPYYAWAHRGLAEMTVWPASEIGAARPSPAPTIACLSKVTVSGGENPEAINDQIEPANSNDHSVPYFHWWPKKGTDEWIQYDFKKREKVSAVEVYWFDDSGRGECRVPASWRVLCNDGGRWKPVEAADRYGVEKDRFNRTTFQPVETDGLRLEIRLQPKESAGVFEWKVE